MKTAKPFPIPVRAKTVHYSYDKCPAYCCTYTDIEITQYDIQRLARHFGVEFEVAERRYTKVSSKGAPLLRHKRDRIFDSACMFLDQKKRQCTVYEARPSLCRDYPAEPRCGYYEFLKFEREHQDDPTWVALTS